MNEYHRTCNHRYDRLKAQLIVFQPVKFAVINSILIPVMAQTLHSTYSQDIVDWMDYYDSGDEISECHSYFLSSSSSASSCYQIVNPQPFFWNCIRQANLDEEGAICQTASVYAKHCSSEGMTVHLPDKCSKLYMIAYFI